MVIAGAETKLTSVTEPAKASNTAIWTMLTTGKATVAKTTGVVTGTINGVGKSGTAEVKATALGGVSTTAKIMVYTVEDVKSRLASLGCTQADGSALTINTTFDANVASALHKFQQANGLASTAKPSNAALDVLFSPAPVACSAGSSSITLTGGLVVPASFVEKTTTVVAKGTVSSTTPLTNLTVQILKSDGITIAKTCTTQNAVGMTTYNLSNCSNDIAFKALTPGSYIYTVTATNSQTTDLMLTYQPFAVGSAGAVIDDGSGVKINRTQLQNKFAASIVLFKKAKDKEEKLWAGPHYRYSIEGGGCTALSGWFILTQTNINIDGYLIGNGNEVASRIAAKLKMKVNGKKVEGPPKAGSIFSSNSAAWGASSRDKNGNLYGHTGIVTSVSWNEKGTVATVQTLETGARRKFSLYSFTATRTYYTASKGSGNGNPGNPDNTWFVYVGGRLK